MLPTYYKLQQFAFSQPNIAILYFPFSLLPACVVPLVALAHLVAIRRLLREHGAAIAPPGRWAKAPAAPAP